MKVQGRIADLSGGGIPDVAASNGEHVVTSPADGSFELPVQPGAHSFVWIAVPEGWRAVNGFFRRVADIGDGGAVFELEPAPERLERSFRLAHITDTHVVAEPGGRVTGDVLRHSMEQLVVESRPDFIVASGDLTNRGTVGELADLGAALAAVDVPVFPLFAGHDGNEERKETGERGASFTRNYESAIGPTHYSFDWGGRHFVLYPTEEGFFSEEDQARKRDWLAADLARQPGGRETVVVVHTPPGPSFLEELAQCGVQVVLFGHWHSSKAFTSAGIQVMVAPPLCFGGIDTTPRGYRLLDFGHTGKVRARSVAVGAGSLTGDSPPPIDGFELDWVATVPGGLHRPAPVPVGDGLLVSVQDEDLEGHAGVRCLSRENGELLWQARTDASVKNQVAVSGGVAVALSITGGLYCLDLVSGHRRWQIDLPGHPDRWLFTAPAMSGETVYAGGKAGYGAYRVGSGEEVWYAPLESSDNWSCYASPLVHGDLLIVLVQRRGLLALDRQSGQIAWEREVGVEYQYPTPVPVGDVLVSGGDRESLLALNPDDGQSLWTCADLGAPHASGLAAAGDRLYAATANGQIQCRRGDDGALCWSVQTGRDLLDMTPYQRGICSILAAPSVLGDLVLAGANDGMLYLVEAATGRCRQQVSFGVPITASAVPLEDGFVVGTWDGKLCRYRRCI